jgi:hypothetical protein
MSAYRMHPNYDSRRLINDIALIFLPSKAIFNQFVQPIALPRDNLADLFVGERATLSGWGRFTDSSWATSPVLRSVSNYVISNEDCARVYGDMVQPSTLCMRNFGEASCHGDSGEFDNMSY